MLPPQTSHEAAHKSHPIEYLTWLSRLYLPISAKMVYTKGMVSSKPWKPIFNVRTRPPWVQVTVFEFLKQLKSLRSGDARLPNIDSISLPSDRQFVVSFGDLDSLCDCIVSALLPHPGILG